MRLRARSPRRAPVAPHPVLVALLITAAGHLRAQQATRDWWSLRPLDAVAVPELRDDWIRNPIDAFVLDALGTRGLEPSPAADRRTLIRRLAFDLHGLPPTPEEIDAFVGDARPDAYERLVDRLLASPRYGERWARHWLDVVHWGETHGFDKDKLRANAWPYRDWVIRSLNADKPWARFVQEQIAGDVLWPDTVDGVVATGFIAAGPWDFVGHVELREGTRDKRITRSLDRDDMVATTMAAFASQTVHCARCHYHKFDPIPSRDYYRLQAVFAGVERADRPYPDAARDAALHRLTAEREQLEARLHIADAAVERAAAAAPAVAQLDAEIQRTRQAIAALAPVLSDDAPPTEVHGYHSQIAASKGVEKWVEVDLGAPRRVAHIALFPSHDKFGGRAGPGFCFPTAFRVDVFDDAGTDDAGHGGDSHPHTVAEHRGETPWDSDDPWVVSLEGIQNRPIRRVRVTATQLRERKGDFALALAELAAYVVRDDGTAENVARDAAVRALDSIEAPVRWSRDNLTDGRLGRGDLDALGAARAWLARAERRLALQTRSAVLARERRTRAVALVPETVRRDLRELPDALGRNAREQRDLPPAPSVYAAAATFAPQGAFTPPPDGPRPVWLLRRGDVDDRAEPVGPGALSVIAELAEHFDGRDFRDEGEGREALAAWLTDPRNPLTWRSIVNRVWQYHFGRGLCATPNDFGHQGALPSHPELLDWLAVRLRDSGGSLKALHRLIVTSATWRQRSDTQRADAAAADSENRLLWRAGRRRLSAEEVRDAMLAVSGRLDLTMGGPSVRHFAFEDDHSPRYLYRQFDVDASGARRRSIYRHVVRSVRDPFFECLDAPDPSLSVPVRYATLTPQQSLTLLNHPFVVRQAEHCAARVAAEARGVGAQVVRAHRLALGRPPNRGEHEALLAHAQRHGLKSVCRVLFNTNEFLFVD